MSNGSYFGLRLRKSIRVSGMTQAEFAKAVDSYPSNVSQWVNGTISPTTRVIGKILRVLPDVDARWLLTGESENSEVFRRLA